MSEYISRDVIRGKPLDTDCKKAHISKHEYGSKDNRCFCYGLYNEWGDDLAEKCMECKAHVDNAEPLKQSIRRV